MDTMTITDTIKKAMEAIWSCNPDLMYEHVKGDRGYNNHWMIKEMTHSVSLSYKYTVTCDQITRLKKMLSWMVPGTQVVVLVESDSLKNNCISAYMYITVGYRG